MRGRNLCFFHTRVSAKPQARPTGMPSLEDGNAIQLGLAEVIRRVLIYDIDYKAAYCLLHAYKLALFNLKNVKLPDLYYSEVVTVDPHSDPENAGQFTEPLNLDQLKVRLRNPEQHLAATGNTNIEVPSKKDENETFKEFLLSQLIAPEDREMSETPSPDHNLSSQAKPRAGAPDSSRWRGGSDLAVEAVEDERKDVQRIVIPKEFDQMIKDNEEMTEEQFNRLTSALFSTKTG